MRAAMIPIALLALSFAAAGEDVGKIGPTYVIEEPNLLRFIEERLREKEKSGELKRLEGEARARVVDTVRNPTAVAGLTSTVAAHTFYYDPTFTLDQNVLDDNGKVLFPAGTKKNPLEVVSLSKHLLFFDSRDERQVERAAGLLQRYGGRVKPILVGGSYLDLMKRWKVPVYYDQHGALVKRLGITHVPALVSQEGLRLRIDELELL